MTAAAREDAPAVPFEETLEELYEDAPCGYATTRPDGTIERVNRTLATWFGAQREDLRGRRFQDLLSIAGRIYYETHLGPLLSMQGSFNEIALELVCRDRPQLPVLVSALQKRDDGGTPVLVHFMVFNAIERRKYERELMMERRRAEKADKAKADLLAMIGHDIRTPLTAIVNTAALLEKQSPTEQQLRYLRTLRSAAAALTGLANQILDFSRLEAGQSSVVDGSFDPRALAAEVIDALAPRAEGKDVRLELRITDAVPSTVKSDVGKVRQILMNVVGNAVKFTERGSVTLSVDMREGMLDLRVTDTGIGIPSDRLDAIFDEFTQANEEIGRKYGGTGLGLAISRKLVELLRGTLTVDSEAGQGSTFMVRLPFE